MRQLRSRCKRVVRRTARRMGYDIVPFQRGFRALQLQQLASIDLVLDVGANVGQYGSSLRSLGYSGQILSFEPQSAAFAELTRVSRGDAAWEVRSVALSSEAGTSVLQVSANSVSSSLLEVRPEHFLAAPGAGVCGHEVVSTNTLDSELQDWPLGKSMWLKLDVQGLELQVLMGAPNTLKNCTAVQVEVSFSELYSGQDRWLDLCGFLESRGFVVRHVEPGFEDPNTGYLQQADLLFLRA